MSDSNEFLDKEGLEFYTDLLNLKISELNSTINSLNNSYTSLNARINALNESLTTTEEALVTGVKLVKCGNIRTLIMNSYKPSTTIQYNNDGTPLAFTIPEGSRPKGKLVVQIGYPYDDPNARLDIYADGNVNMFVSSGLPWPANTGIYLTATWVV